MVLGDRHRWMLTGTLAALVAGLCARLLLQQQWRRATRREPPKDPISAETPWVDALAWTALTGIVGGVASLIARRGAAHLWHMKTGTDPRRL